MLSASSSQSAFRGRFLARDRGHAEGQSGRRRPRHSVSVCREEADVDIEVDVDVDMDMKLGDVDHGFESLTPLESYACDMAMSFVS